MEINKHNYEAFFLDYHEGNLTPQQVADLLLFVEQHPELKEEFESFENVTLEDFSSYNYKDKQDLKKEINLANKEEYFIHSVEGTLNNTEQDLLNNYLEQHPQFLNEFNLFQKTKLVADTNIVFTEKEKLKRVPETADNLLISAVEGLLSKEESILLTQQLSVDPDMRKELALYQQTKLKADTSVIYENKKELKYQDWTSSEREDKRKPIPFFYYISGIAAAILLLFGLFTFFNNGNTAKQKLAVEIPTTAKKQHKEIKSQIPATNFLATNNSQKINVSPSLTKKEKIKINVAILKTVDSANSMINTQNNFAENIPENKQDDFQKQIAVTKKPEEKIDVNPVLKSEKKLPSIEFLSLGQIAATKIKEKTLDPGALAIEKEHGRLKKLSGWDIAQIVAKGVSKITGKKVEAKPTYNEEGEVTAYALGAGGFQISRGK
jgi:hypothetical protein